MYSHLTDWELSILCVVIGIFTIAPISIAPDSPNHPNRNRQQLDLDRLANRSHASTKKTLNFHSIVNYQQL
jgi:hypothetical protein